MLNVTEGGLPSSRASSNAEIEEERRLLYVAMTRAERELTLMTPMQRPSFGGNGQTGNDAIGNRSRFLPDSILSTFAVSAWRLHDDDDDDGGRGLGTTASSDIQARIRNRCLDA